MSTVIKTEHKKTQETKVIITTGLALFAMFFGAGNVLYPLHLGANAGQHIMATMWGFLLLGVGVPFLGLLATSLFNGSYHDFFGRLGKYPAFLLITFLIILIGPLVAIPRTEATTFHTILPFLPEAWQNNTSFSFLFSLIYCGIVFFLAYKETKVVSILGLILSPIKIISFSCLVIIGLIYMEPPLVNQLTELQAFKNGMSHGYNTMDLLGAFFFCSVAFKAIQLETKEKGSAELDQSNKRHSTLLTLKACILGAAITAAVYIGFMFVAYGHASALQGLREEQMISAVSHAVLGKFGGLFVCIAVSFACIATALALTTVSSDYLYREVFKHSISKHWCLGIVVAMTMLMSNIGFQGIMKFSLPILNVVYPTLIVLCVMNILYKWKGIKCIKLPVALTALGFTAYELYCGCLTLMPQPI
jgi:LIVCS family branched-chain amino acid:cation transporter